MTNENQEQKSCLGIQPREEDRIETRRLIEIIGNDLGQVGPLMNGLSKRAENLAKEIFENPSHQMKICELVRDYSAISGGAIMKIAKKIDTRAAILTTTEIAKAYPFVEAFFQLATLYDDKLNQGEKKNEKSIYRKRKRLP